MDHQKAVGVLKKKADKITGADLQKVIDHQEKIREKFGANGPLVRFIQNAKLMLSLVRDYYSGDYREIPWWAIAAVVAALLYVFSPFDMAPDFIPFVGYIDDAGIVAACLLLVEQQLIEYQAWLNKRHLKGGRS